MTMPSIQGAGGRPPVKGGSERLLRAGGFAFTKTKPPVRLRLTTPFTGGKKGL
jgi:hypothetical protein